MHCPWKWAVEQVICSMRCVGSSLAIWLYNYIYIDRYMSLFHSHRNNVFPEILKLCYFEFCNSEILKLTFEHNFVGFDFWNSETHLKLFAILMLPSSFLILVTHKQPANLPASCVKYCQMPLSRGLVPERMWKWLSDVFFCFFKLLSIPSDYLTYLWKKTHF